MRSQFVLYHILFVIKFRIKSIRSYLMCVGEEYEDQLPEYIACVNSEVVPQTRHRHEATQLTSHRLPTLGCQRVAVLHSHVLQTTCCLKTDEPGRPRGLVTTSTDQPDKPYGPV